MDLLLTGQYAAALLTISTLVGLFIKWAVVKPIKLYIDKMTYPIQPHSNGGKSLPDLINTVDEIKALVKEHIKNHDTPK
jgi:hypothetical protein